jgi:malate synthase
MADRVKFMAILGSLAETGDGLRYFECLFIENILIAQERVWGLSAGRWSRIGSGIVKG